MPRLTWRVAPAPTGRYRSFQHRSWPTASEGDKIVFQIVCDDDYAPARVRRGEHGELRILAAVRNSDGGPGFTWRALKQRAATLDEAKHIAETFLMEQRALIFPDVRKES